MILSLFRKNKGDRARAYRQYDLLAQAARRPEFFLEASVPDTVIGRFELLSIMMILYFKRTAESSELIRKIAQEVADAFFEDLDHSLRELGVGDHGVPKRLKKFTQMFYGRLNSYGDAMDAGDLSGLEAALLRNIYPDRDVSGLSMNRLARYMLETMAAFRALPDEAFIAGSAAPIEFRGEE